MKQRDGHKLRGQAKDVVDLLTRKVWFGLGETCDHNNEKVNKSVGALIRQNAFHRTRYRILTVSVFHGLSYIL